MLSYDKLNVECILIGSYSWSYDLMIRGHIHIDYITINKICFLYLMSEIDSGLLWVCTVLDHRTCQIVWRKSVTHSCSYTSCATFLFLHEPYFNVIFGLLLNRCTVTWNLIVNYMRWVLDPQHVIWVINAHVLGC